MNTRKIASVTGWLMVVTFVTSIPAYFFYAPARNHPEYITGAGADPTASVALGAVLELILIIANVGTAVVPYVVFRRYSQGLALGYGSAAPIGDSSSHAA
jgi:Mn2+/Fe2+ NRAMP family transporter